MRNNRASWSYNSSIRVLTSGSVGSTSLGQTLCGKRRMLRESTQQAVHCSLVTGVLMQCCPHTSMEKDALQPVLHRCPSHTCPFRNELSIMIGPHGQASLAS